MNTAAILRATEEVLLGSIGTVRTVDADELALDAYSGQTDEARAAAARVRARVEVEPLTVKRTGAVAPETASRAILEIELAIRFAFTTEHELEDSERRAAHAAALDTVETARKALAWPGNLVETSAADATSLVGGCLYFRSLTRARADFRTRLIEYELRMFGLVNESQATS